MIDQTRAIVLQRIKYSDHSTIAHFYTEKFGLLAIMIRHSRSKKSVSKKSILQPLFLLNLNIQHKQNREIQQCKEMNNTPVFHDIPFNIIKSSITLFLAEILTKVLKEEEANPSLFEYLHSSIQLFDHIDKGIANFHLIFLYELSKFLGFYPDKNYSSQNRYFNIREGFYSGFRESKEVSLDENLSRHLQLISSKGFNALNEIDLSRNQRTNLLLALIKYFQFHLPEIGKIKSIEVLNQVFEP